MKTETRYSLGHTPEEYERLRVQARRWTDATGRLLDRIALTPGARCLDAGCGPGETMRLMAQRVGPSGRVVGVDRDAALAGQTLAALHDAGHRHCDVQVADLATDPLPEQAYDLVYARLLLFHLPERGEVLRRLWDAVAPGGHLVVHEYDLSAVGVHPSLASAEAMGEVLLGAFGAAGCDVRIGTALPELMREAVVGEPDGTDVAGLLEPLRDGGPFLDQTFRSLVPLAVARGLTTPEGAAALSADLARDIALHPDRPMLLPLLIGAWKRKAPQ